jgi:hypothetical protein
MIMKDCLLPKDRLYFKNSINEDNFLRECCGCGRNTLEIISDDEISHDDLEWSSKELDSGEWYCHADCYRDSR